MLLAALHHLYVNDGFRTVTKRRAIDFITRKRWFALRDDDYEPYPSQHGLTGEPRWHTLIAWARKDSVLRDLISYEERDAWGLTRTGRDAFERTYALCENRAGLVAPCFLWSVHFKRFMSPKYLPSSADSSRPRSFYRDIWGPPERFLKKAKEIISNGTWPYFATKYRELLGGPPDNWTPTHNCEGDAERLGRMISAFVEAQALRDMGLQQPVPQLADQPGHSVASAPCQHKRSPGKGSALWR